MKNIIKYLSSYLQHKSAKTKNILKYLGSNLKQKSAKSLKIIIKYLAGDKNSGGIVPRIISCEVKYSLIIFYKKVIFVVVLF